MQNRLATMTRDLLEDGLSAGFAWPFVTEFGACVVATLQRFAANTGADVLGFKIDVKCSRYCIQEAQFLLLRYALLSPFFTWTALFTTLVPTTIERGFACSRAHRDLASPLMAFDLIDLTSAPASHIHRLRARWTGPGVACFLAMVTTRKLRRAQLIAAGNRILAGFPRDRRHLGQGCFPTWTVDNNVGGTRAMRSVRILRMARSFTNVLSAIERPLA
jgi:hypothetical protein